MAKTRPRNPPRKRDRAPVEAPEDLAADQIDPHRGPWTDEEKALYFGAPEETPIARREAAILRRVRQTEEQLGINIMDLLSGMVLAEDDVRDFEERRKRTLGGVSFSPPTPEGWKALDVLTEIIRNVPHALECRRVMDTLQTLRKMWQLREAMEGSLPPELEPLLGRIGAAIVDAPKLRFANRGRTSREIEILEVWKRRKHLGANERQKAAEALGLAGWESVKSIALRYIRARSRGWRSEVAWDRSLNTLRTTKLRRAFSSEHVLRQEAEAPAPERPAVDLGAWAGYTIETADLCDLERHRTEPSGIAGRDALLPGYARRAEALGFSAVNLLNEALVAEIDVRDFERRTGRALEVERFTRAMRTCEDLSRVLRTIALSAGMTEEMLLELLPRFAKDWKAKGKLAAGKAERLRGEIAEGWKALDVLTEIIRNVPHALECRRVRYALAWLRAPRLLREEKDTPRELKALLRRIGAAVADPKKIPRRKPTPRQTAILNVWRLRKYLDRDARERDAEACGLADWVSLERVARRYIAREKEPAHRLDSFLGSFDPGIEPDFALLPVILRPSRKDSTEADRWPAPPAGGG